MKDTGSSRVVLVDGSLSGGMDEEINYKYLFQQYFLGRWYLYVLFVGLFVSLSYLYIKTVQPQYEITSKLLINEKKDNLNSNDDFLKQNLRFSAVSENVTNEIEVLTAYHLMRSVVEELDLQVRYYWRDELTSYEAYKTFPIVVDTFSLTHRSDQNPEFIITPLDTNTFEFGQKEPIGVYTFGKVFTNSFGTFCIRKNGNLPQDSNASMYISFLSLDEITTAYLDNFGVNLSDTKNKSSILYLTLVDALPERGIDILNHLIDKYHQQKYEESNVITLKTLEFIDDRLNSITKDLASVESSVENFKLNNNIASETTSDLNIVLDNVNELSKQQSDLKVQIDIIDSMKAYLVNGERAFELIPLNLSLVTPQIQGLVKPYNDMVIRRDQLLMSGKPSNPVIEAVNQELVGLRSSIRIALDKMGKDMTLQLEAANRQYDTYAHRLRGVPTKERELLEKSRKQDITEELYVYLLRKREETSLALVRNYSKSNVIDPPRSSIHPVAPNKTLIYFGGLLGGLGIPFFIIFALNLLQDSIQTEKELKKEVVGAGLLGIISQHKGKEQQVVMSQRKTLASELFRSLRTNLQFQYRDKHKCVMVTSSMSNEGKTFVAVNLATSFALAKKKTVIIDFDMHKPDLGKYIKESGKKGLSDFFSGDIKVEEIIQASEITPHLDYISCGPVPMNPGEVITETKLDELFDYLKETYEVVIIDTPPIGIISDAILLNKYITNSIFVIRSGYTKKVMMEKLNQMIKNEILVNPSLVLNGVTKTGMYGYGYGDYQRYAS